jgi:hypothetical protein
MDVPDKFTEEDKKKFEDDENYNRFRWELESEMNVNIVSPPFDHKAKAELLRPPRLRMQQLFVGLQCNRGLG